MHVHPAAVRIAYAAKGADGIALVTDAMQAAGMPDGVYELSGRRVSVEDGAARLDDGTLAGATVTMDEAVRRAAGFLGDRPRGQDPHGVLEDAAAALGLDPGIGRIRAGARWRPAALADGVVEETLVAGQPWTVRWT